MNENFSTRREFLQKSLALVAACGTVPLFINQTVLAMADPRDVKRTQQFTGKDEKILVVVQLSGGNDGLNTVVPYADDEYHRRRPGIGIERRSVLRLDDHIGLHPNLAGLKELYDDGRLSVVQGVGYPNPNRSHFRSMDIWHSAQPKSDSPTSGWIGRYFDNTCSGCDPHVGICIGEQVPLAMQGQKITPLSFERPEMYRYAGRDRAGYEKLLKDEPEISNPKSEIPNLGSQVSSESTIEFLHRTALDAQVSSDRIIRLSRGHAPRVAYPLTEFGNSLRTVAAMIRGGMPTRVYYVSLGGFDTHANQKGRHDQLMQQLAAGLKAFTSDLKEQRNHDRVLVMTFSEFGRRVQQNASNGTDHGAAAPMFLIGPALTQGIVGRHPSLTDLDQGDLKHQTDFRSVYATVLEKWLDTRSAPVLGGTFAPLPVLRA